MLKVGIVGLPNVGKSTLFNVLLRRQQAQVANRPYTTIKPNVGVVGVPDERLSKIYQIVADSKSEIRNSKQIQNPNLLNPKIIPATVEFVDIAGLVKGAHRGEGLGNQFLAHIREVDAVIILLRSFADSSITHTESRVDPQGDLEILKLELELADQDHPDAPKLSQKPRLIVENVDEKDLASPTKKGWLKISAKLEAELAALPENDQKELLKEIGLSESPLARVIYASYKLLDLQTFFTAGPKEVRAWTVRKGATASEAAGAVHSDFQRGFIRAEVISFSDYIDYRGEQGAKLAGRLRSEGRDYVIKDGDIIYFRFNV